MSPVVVNPVLQLSPMCPSALRVFLTSAGLTKLQQWNRYQTVPNYLG